MHTSTLKSSGRLGNHIIRNIALSLVAKKHDLFVEYSFFDAIKKLGIPLHIGTKNYNNMLALNEDNFLKILNQKNLTSNINCDEAFFQSREIIKLIHQYLLENRGRIQSENKFKKNKDTFVHVRIGDIEDFMVSFSYYEQALSQINNKKIYISSDSPNHSLIKKILRLDYNIELISMNETDAIMLGSSCENIVLSHGSFSALIGLLSFSENVYYPKYERANTIWFGDMFKDKNWKPI